MISVLAHTAAQFSETASSIYPENTKTNEGPLILKHLHAGKFTCLIDAADTCAAVVCIQENKNLDLELYVTDMTDSGKRRQQEISD